MKRMILAVVASAFMTIASAHTPSLTPRPASLEMKEDMGSFRIAPSTKIIVESPSLLPEMKKRVATTELSGLEVVDKPAASGDVILRLVDTLPPFSSPEAYRLDVMPSMVMVESTSPDGLYYGLVTLGQLARENADIPAMTIADAPRLPYRGMMVDVSRHFHGLDFLKKQVDAMAALKLNRLHLHLTDAAGWRLEIKKYPRLTSYAAWRPQETWAEWSENGATYCDEGSPEAHGGYFTADQMRELIDYAAARGIEVIPEIEMPGHSAEVTAAYPELGCSHDGSDRQDLCPGNEATYEFLEGVLDEVMEIFPSKYIHIGGDEASKAAWKTCSLCVERMEKEGLKDVDELQSYLITRMEKYLNSKGRDLMGWDEIMEGGLAPNATVMSWRGVEGGLRAAADGHHAVMTPGAYCYLDSYQDAPHTQPRAFGGYLPLKKVYSYNPVPDTIPEYARDLIMGLQGNLWCEYVPTDSHAEYMLWPRMIAIAEAAWTPQELRDWDDFRPRALDITERMRKAGYSTFDLANEVGNRKEAEEPVDHLAKGKKVTYLRPYYPGYTAGGDGALVDGIRGGWNYSDQLWQGFISGKSNERIDLVIDLGKEEDITFVGADFMQIVTPDVWMPTRVEIYASLDGENFTLLRAIDRETKADEGVSFLNFGWEGQAKARYVRYKAFTERGFLFTDEIVVK